VSTQPLRVLIFLDSLCSGGAQRQAVSVFNGLRRQGVDAWLTTYYPLDHFLSQVEDTARFACLNKRVGDGKVPFFVQLRGHVQQLQPSVVASFLREPAQWIALLRLSGLRFRWLLSERSSRFDLMSKRRRMATLGAAHLADRVCPNSHTAADELRALGFPDRQLGYLPNGITLPSVPEAPRLEGPLRLLMVGSMTPLKNHKLVLDALCSLDRDDWVLEHAGRTPDAELHDAVLQTIAHNGVADKVVLHGAVSDLGPLYRRADVVVHPSRYEGFPNVLLEAWAHRTPVLVSDRCDLPRLVSHGEDGLVFALDTPEALASALNGVLDGGRSPLRSLGDRGRQRVEQAYTIEAVTEAWLSELRSTAQISTHWPVRALSSLRGR
jgi:glycosyltransferase involved in cell wall biosynthesis